MTVDTTTTRICLLSLTQADATMFPQCNLFSWTGISGTIIYQCISVYLGSLAIYFDVKFY